jgi:ABC-type lipoprotein export system ATPase subunit
MVTHDMTLIKNADHVYKINDNKLEEYKWYFWKILFIKKVLKDI